MTTCNRDVGKRWLAGALPALERDAFVVHLDECGNCQRWLELDAGDVADWAAARKLLQTSANATNLRSAQRMHRAAAGENALREDVDTSGRLDLSFLAPSDEPASLGRIGTYEVVGVIGRGGMGIVLKACDVALGRTIALKVLAPVLAGLGAARQRFAREARAMAALSHEHIVPIYSVDEHHGLPYLAMEYVPGGTLETRLHREGALDVVSILRIGIQVAHALAAAHDTGLVHRDVKPANILLDRGVERVRVADFGLATVANEGSFTASGVLAGTPLYMSPEQVQGRTCGPCSDLFSLGGVMYAMATGHAPFRSETLYGTLHRIVADAPRPVREQRPEIPEWLEELIGRLLAKEAADRFASAAELASVLEQELARLQNPALVSAPERPWLNKSAADQRSLGGGRRRQVSLVMGITLLAFGGWLAWGLMLLPAGSTDDAKDSQGRIERGPQLDWRDADDLRNVTNQLDNLNRQMYDDSETPTVDEWEEGIDRVKRALAQLNQ